ncbi:hypothetical protein PR001_g20152 [Phytophthora rubi]|uniref:Temptin Cys/Cys disulfide domain-containing protein n=1 Tax=Phytophthora rubi TaxID=129364 RepID=A0A6A3JK57_9STRA|nr:hypothetical protein PR001_g20152 [Phytophthora rubi]KAE9041296.1 hypothetical protein PR002_g4517 [Phytophthora rubi]
MKLLLVAVAVATLSTVQVEAKQEFVKLIPNAARVSGVTAIGHTDGTGASSANNDFGKAFDSAGKVWTLNLCKADTDGDGQTNGQELGDPCCEWTEGAQPRWTSGVSHPRMPQRPPTKVCGPTSTARTSRQLQHRRLRAQRPQRRRWRR